MGKSAQRKIRLTKKVKEDSLEITLPSFLLNTKIIIGILTILSLVSFGNVLTAEFSAVDDIPGIVMNAERTGDIVANLKMFRVHGIVYALLYSGFNGSSVS